MVSVPDIVTNSNLDNRNEFSREKEEELNRINSENCVNP
jgi:hypothetical protein